MFVELFSEHVYNIIMIDLANALGAGIYTPREAAFYARVRPDLITRWIFGGPRGERVVDPQFEPSNGKVVTFLDFIQAMAIRAIRLKYKIPLGKIRKAVDKAKRDFSVEYPFAMPHTTIFVFSDQSKMGHGELMIERDDGQIVQLSGRASGNLVFRQIVEPYLDHVEFDQRNLACRYTAWTRGDRKIIMDPHFHFGEPILHPCGYTAKALWEAVDIEGSVDEAAAAYGVDRKDVMTAWEFYDHLRATQLREDSDQDSV
jgi:uncharacterized protein (DUF433 family)